MRLWISVSSYAAIYLQEKIDSYLYKYFRDKRRYANIRRRSEAKHYSSLCSQSEGDEYCGGQALKIQQSQGPTCWPCSLRVRGPHFASKVSYSAGAATARSAAFRRLSPIKAFTLPANNEVWKQSEHKKSTLPFGGVLFSMYSCQAHLMNFLRPRI